jgi:hypothetical protein
MALAVASAASAAPTVTLVWTGTTGTGTAGGSSIASVTGETLTLDILITSDSNGVSASGLSYDITTAGTVTGGVIWAGADGIVTFNGFTTYNPVDNIKNTATYGGPNFGAVYVTGSGVTCPFPATGNSHIGCAQGTLPVIFTGVDQGNGTIGSFAAGPGGFATVYTYTQARAQFEVVSIDPPFCPALIDINALRGGSPTVTSGGTKDITAKARIRKGTAPLDATVDDTTLTITSYVGPLVVDQKVSGPLTLVVGKGGTGDTLTMDVPACNPGQTIDYVAHFSGTASTNGALCEATSGRLSKTCK